MITVFIWAVVCFICFYFILDFMENRKKVQEEQEARWKAQEDYNQQEAQLIDLWKLQEQEEKKYREAAESLRNSQSYQAGYSNWSQQQNWQHPHHAQMDGIYQALYGQYQNSYIEQERLRQEEIRKIAESFSNFNKNNFSHPITKYSSEYQLLGKNVNDSDLEIKKAYRHLISKYHPDKVTANGGSENDVIVATEQSKKIISAYEKICSERGMK